MNLLKRPIALLVCAAISLQTAFPVFAELTAATSADTATTAASSTATTDNELPYILWEDTEQREAQSKTFLLSDGSYLTAVYPTVVHKENDNGTWTEIDNTLTEETTFLAESDAVSTYKTSRETGSLDVEFHSALQNNTIFSIGDGEHSVTVSLIDWSALDQAPVAPATPEPSDLVVMEEPERENVTDEPIESAAPEDAVSSADSSVTTEDTEEVPGIQGPEQSNTEPDAADDLQESVQAESAESETSAESENDGIVESAEPLTEENTENTEAANVLDAESAAMSAALVPEETVAASTAAAADPTPEMTPELTGEFAAVPTMEPEAAPTEEPEETPVPMPVETAAPSPSVAPSAEPTIVPTEAPEQLPESDLTSEQLAVPTAAPGTDVVETLSPEAVYAKGLLEAHPELHANVSVTDLPVLQIASSQLEPVSGNGGAQLAELVQNPQVLAVDGLYQELAYEDVFEHVDLEYSVYGNTVKENILVKQPLDSYQFAFELDLDGLTYTKNENGSISLADASGSGRFTIHTPVMFDADGAMGTAVAQEIVAFDGHYYLLISADEEWMANAAFPVAIDPTISTDVDLSQSIRSSHVTETNSYNDVSLLAAGRLPNEDKRIRGYLKFDLPSLPDGSVISRAFLQMGVVEIYDYNGADPRLYATAYLCPEDWDPATITWSTQPGTPNRNPKEYMPIVESHDIYAGDKGYYVNFDITKAVSVWNQGTQENYGLVFADGFEENNYNHYTTLSTYLYDNYPVITVTYRVINGLESYWDTYSAGIDGAGTAHVNLFTGNLTVDLPVYTDTARNMPFSFSLVYNSVDRLIGNIEYSYGRGWHSNIAQRLYYVEEGEARYRYIDADRTYHYLIPDGSTEWRDEDGLNMTMTKIDNYYILEDNDRMKYYFDRSYPNFLRRIVDTNGNEIAITNADTATTITASGNRAFKLNYNTGGYFISFEDCIGRTYSVSYSGSRLHCLSYPDGKQTLMNYTSDGNYNMTDITGPNGYALKFTWDEQMRVASITEYNGDIAGQTISFDYRDYCTTRVRTSGPDDVHGNADDLITHYLFDEWGRTATVYTTDSTGKAIYGLQNTAFTEAESGETSNRLTKTVAHGAAAINLLSNSSLEDGISEFSQGVWSGTGTASLSQSSGSSMSTSYQGYRAGKLTVTANTGVVAAQRTVTLAPGDYTFSGYLKTENVQTSSDGGAALGVKAGSTVYQSRLLTGTSGNTFSIDDQSSVTDSQATYVSNNKSINAMVENGWQRVSVSFSLTAETTVVLGAILENATGAVLFDALQLEKSSTASPYNMLENSGFEDSALGTAVPAGWTAGTNMSDSNKVWDHMYSSAETGYEPFAGSNAYRMVGRVNYGTAYNTGLTQLVPIQGNAGDVYTISGWVDLWSVPDTVYTRSIHQIACNIKYSNGQSVTIATAKANPYFIGWQYVSESFVLKNDQGSGVTITGLEVVLQFDNLPFYAAFDNIHLVKDEGMTYTYDTEGKLVSTSALKEQQANVAYNEDTDLPESYTDVYGNKTNYTYDTSTRNLLLTEGTSAVNVSYRYSTATKGNPTAMILSGSGDSKHICTTYSYLDGGNFSYTTTNALGKTSTVYYNIYDPDYTGSADHILPDPISAYPYVTDGSSSGASGYTDPDTSNNRLTGQIYAIKDEAGTLQYYAYTDAEELAGVTKSGLSVDYTYTNSRLNTIRNGDALYQFSYDTYGALTGVTTGGQTLVSNTYAANNGKLTTSAYAGTTVSYSYDALEQLAQKSYAGGDTVTYTYDGDGNLVQSQQAGGLGRYYTYNNAGTLIGMADTNGFTAQYKYDVGDRVTMVSHSQDGDSRSTAFVYSRNTQMKLFKITGGTADIQGRQYFEELDRVYLKEYTTGDQKFYIRVYYRDGATALTDVSSPSSTQVSGYLYCDGADSTRIEASCFYRYDALGNISEVRRATNGSSAEALTVETFRWYSYDANSQLVRVDDLETGETICFSYDDQGNIVRRTYHAYTRSTPGAATRTDTWTYGGADGNVLTSSTINGVTTNYSYAAYGIPTAWTENRALLWSNGTQLAAIGNAAFTYDGEGQRLSKTVSGKTTGYTYEGTNLIRQKNADGSRLFFLYDANGLIGFDYIPASGSAQTYFYRFDGEGRITAVVDPAGDVVAQYAYDPWGVITAVTDADGNAVSSSHIGNLNPIRYKGYYYDAETGLYYLNSRYYDPEVCRFVSADDVGLLGATRSVISFNLFAYSRNNPIVYKDTGGTTPELVFDVISVGVSIADVASNPYDPWAWAGLAGDLIDVAVPFIGGVGESIKFCGAVQDTTDVIAAAKKMKAVTSDAVGTYEIVYKSGKNYVGKGRLTRAIKSAERYAKPHVLNGMAGDTVLAITWKRADSTKAAFITEYLVQQSKRGVLSADNATETYNIIWSPGRRYLK